MMPRPDLDTMLPVFTDLLATRGLPAEVRWVFAEDVCRLRPQMEMGHRYAFRPRTAAQAQKILRYACGRLPLQQPIAFVAYAVLDGALIAGLQGDVFSAADDVHRKDWNAYFDTLLYLDPDDPGPDGHELVTDDATWERLWREQPSFASELDYLVSVNGLVRDFGFEP